MTKSEKIRLIYGIFLGVFTLALGIVFIIEAADIYYSGEGYSYEGVGARLLTLLAPVILYILAVIAGFVLSVLFPTAEKRKIKRDALEVYDRLQKKLPASGEGEFSAIHAMYNGGEFLRLVLRILCGVFCLLAAVMSIVYLADAAHFENYDGPNEAILQMLKNVLPWIGAAFVLVCGVIVFEGIYAKKALPAVKKMIALGRGEPEISRYVRAKGAVSKVLDNKHTILALRLAVLTIGLTLLIIGIVRFQGVQDVFSKAVKICLECIGLG